MWLNHHRMFRMVRYATHSILLLNGLLLLMVTVIPFPTALVAEYVGGRSGHVAAAVYTGWFVATSLVWNALWRFAASPARRPAVLALPPGDPAVQRMSRAFLMGPVVYLLAFAASFRYPALAVALCGAVAVGFSLAPNE